MNRSTWLQERRMKKFRDVLSRWERRKRTAGPVAVEVGPGRGTVTYVPGCSVL